MKAKRCKIKVSVRILQSGLKTQILGLFDHRKRVENMEKYNSKAMQKEGLTSQIPVLFELLKR